METLQQTERRIILIRHGETEWNRLQRFQGRSDVPLNKRGREQARALAPVLRDEIVTAIHTSPLKRAVETAMHIAEYHPSAPFIKEPELMEMDLGDFEGLEGRQWVTQYRTFRKKWEEAPAALSMPGGESLEDVQHRAVQAMKRIAEASPPGSTLLLCSHNFVIVSLLCFASKTPLDQFREMHQGTAALNILSTDGTNWRIEVVNDRSHLEGMR